MSDTNDWHNLAACRDSGIDFFEFPTYREKSAARQVCMRCPVRLRCLQDSLEKEDLFGMWGGIDEQERRRALSLDQYGHPSSRRLPPRCPNCKAEVLAVLEKRRNKSKVKCNRCQLVWWTRRSLTRKQRSVDEPS